ncbi:DUF4910 domain-containing protein [Parvicella tangerina]|uniref:Polysaccharide biosynthesis protein with aminopeptidase-like domain protein n=1 Tax=Parvicella tangerina TaxID=2829795 RepID=A0A916NAS1_9FLAO|nr:DUF4910 domain-containing protein [Parvicella tangerina]CAG5079751.1 Putative polysaccharide biosynthesis protein with aminopeptidase-like domain protein [Parvicella tangerina]
MDPKIIESYFDRLWPICRSITGNGLRDSFRILKELIPLNLTEVPSGTKVLDWQIPKEWNIHEAFIKDEEGKTIVDFKENNLHVLNYSFPVDKVLSGDELKDYLYTKEELPDAIPYVTSYYKEKWGFCLSYNQFKTLDDRASYKVKIDSTLENGSLTYGDFLLKGKSRKQIVFSSYLCHPSMANNELSGPLTLAFLYDALEKNKELNYSYRFVIAPETIGSIAYLEKYGEELMNDVVAGYVLTCCGDANSIAYKKSRKGDTLAERVTERVLKSADPNLRVDEFDVDGSDERQYCSPGFNLPFVSLYRSKYSEYKEYHTSLDNKDLMSFDSIVENVELLLEMINEYERTRLYVRTNPFGEPQLGKRNLYEDLASKSSHSEALKLRMRLLNFCDGERPLDEFIEKYGYNDLEVEDEIRTLEHGELIRQV